MARLCRDIDVGVRTSAATDLHEMGKPAVRLLVELLKDKSRVVRLAAIRSLNMDDGDAKDAMPALVGFLADNDEETRRAAEETLQSMGAAAAPCLARLITDPNAKLRKAAADA